MQRAQAYRCTLHLPSPCPPLLSALANDQAPAPASRVALDDFWNYFISYNCLGFGLVDDDWQSLAEMVQDADVVIVGTPTRIEYRHEPGKSPKRRPLGRSRRRCA